MGDKFELKMRDPCKAPYDQPLLIKAEEGGYVVATRIKGQGWFMLDEWGELFEEWLDGGEYVPVELETPQFYCELPK